MDNLSRCRALLPEDDPNYAVGKKSTKVHARAPALQAFYDKEKEIKKSNIFLEIAGATLFSRASLSLFLTQASFLMLLSSQGQVFPDTTHLILLDEQKEGPYSVLHACLTSSSSRRIRVVTRGLKSIRGQIIGTLLGYDKHLNLVHKSLVAPSQLSAIAPSLYLLPRPTHISLFMDELTKRCSSSKMRRKITVSKRTDRCSLDNTATFS